MSYFYSHLVEIETVVRTLDELELSEDQKSHLAGLVDSTIHYRVMDLILSKLPAEDKKVFLQKMQDNPRDKQLMKLLNSKIGNIETDITEAVQELKLRLHEDIKQARSLPKPSEGDKHK